MKEPKHVEADVAEDKPATKDHLHEILADFMNLVYETLDRGEHSPRPADSAARAKIAGRLRALKR